MPSFTINDFISISGSAVKIQSNTLHLSVKDYGSVATTFKCYPTKNGIEIQQIKLIATYKRFENHYGMSLREFKFTKPLSTNVETYIITRNNDLNIVASKFSEQKSVIGLGLLGDWVDAITDIDVSLASVTDISGNIYQPETETAPTPEFKLKLEWWQQTMIVGVIIIMAFMILLYYKPQLLKGIVKKEVVV